jgi:hypothetical protein
MLKSPQQIANVQVVNPKITWAVYGMHLLQKAAIVIISVIIETQYRPEGFIKLNSTIVYPKSPHSVFVLFKFKMLKNHHFSLEPWFHSVAQNQFQPQVQNPFQFLLQNQVWS